MTRHLIKLIEKVLLLLLNAGRSVASEIEHTAKAVQENIEASNRARSEGPIQSALDQIPLRAPTRPI